MEKFQSRAVTLTLAGNAQYPICPRYFLILQCIRISCCLIDHFLSYHAKTWKHTQTHAHTDSDEYSIVAFAKTQP